MSFLDHPDDIEAPNIQVWNNAAFDNGESDVAATVRTLSWSTVQDSYKNHSSELQTDCSKENLCPLSLKTPASVKYSVPAKPLNRNGVIENSQGKPLKTPGMVSTKLYAAKGKEEEEEEVICKERNIDAEIEETEKEISRLSTRLKALQIEKAEQNAARTTVVQRGGRFVPFKSIEPKVSGKNSDAIKTFDYALIETKIGQRGLSLGPSEIHAGVGARRQGKTELTPVQRLQSRRQSCLPKLLDIDEQKANNRRGSSMSLSPKSRRTLIKAHQGVRQPATTVVSKRPVKKDGVLDLIQPKKLFIKDVEKSVPPSAKKPIRTGRIVASRYNQTNENSAVATENRKRSLPGNCKDDGSSRYDKRRSSSELCRSKAPQSRVKKRWEIPSENEIMVLQQEMEENCATSVSKVGDMLPRIRTTRCANQSPRDSGPAKRVAELIDSKTNFFADEEMKMEASICQKLNFTEDEEE